MSNLLNAINLIKETFDKYSDGDGPDATLSKKALTQLIKDELLGDSTPSDEIEQYFNLLDEDGDGVVDYNEYVTAVAAFSALLQGLD